MADPTFQPKVYLTSGGDKQVVASGGEIDVETGGALKIAGTDRTAALATAPAGVVAGYKIARGSSALDGSNPTTIATGLATIVAAVATLKGTSAPGDNTSVLTVNYAGSDGNLDIYAWKNTSGSDPTLVASTGTENFDWIAIGT
ncbi:hypothetical protein FRZ44_38100 [Hypericibacter terrae]|uniref:Uncharacterized protein n=1 Tax=Hypericibacter terrae TaxID=2602015 RepID=A0A5J6MMA4_9PROT|nr:hypothetical protein [Hypericibacter terrae]QEX18503.1 hypothetical protein FRZ44_38100 [Hypericibacter terrae]